MGPTKNFDESHKFSSSLALISALFFIFFRMVFFTGIEGSDDLQYANIAHAMSTGDYSLAFPTKEQTPSYGPHFSMRYGILFPLALTFSLLGVSEFTATLPSLIYSLGMVLLAYYTGRRFFNTQVGLIAACLIAFLPLEVLLSTSVSVDSAVAFWLSLSIILILRDHGSDSPPSWRPYLLAGVCWGIGFVTKVISVLLFPAILVLALFDHPKRRLFYTYICIGFVLVEGTELLIYLLGTGDPLTRYHVVRSVTTNFMMESLQEKNLWYRLFVEYPLQLFHPGKSHYFSLFPLLTAVFLIAQRSVLRANPATRNMAIWWGIGLMAVNFAPSQLWPYLPALEPYSRHIAFISIPLVVLLGCLLNRYSYRFLFVCLTFLVVVALFHMTLIYANHVKGPGVAYNDREVSRFLKTQTERPIFTDQRTEMVLEFFFAYDRNDRINRFPPLQDAMEQCYVVANWKRLEFLERSYAEPVPTYVTTPPGHWRKIHEGHMPTSVFEQVRISLGKLTGMSVAPIPQAGFVVYEVP